MSQFICAVSSDRSGTPSAFALAEKQASPAGSRYVIRDLETLGDEALTTLQNRLAADPQYAGQVTLVMDGGRKRAQTAHDTIGLSVVPVQIVAGESPSRDALGVSPAELVDTFEGLYRAGAIAFQNADDLASAALSALYVHAEAGAGAADDDRFEDEEMPTAAAVDGPQSTIEQSGNATELSTTVVGEGAAKALKDSMEGARPAARADRGFDDVDLGEHRAPALALALAAWYGEFSDEAVPLTDQAAATARRQQVRNAARARARNAAR